MTTFGEYLIALALLLLLGLLADPFMIWMPTQTEMLLVFIAALLAVVYAGFILKEKTTDEREVFHRMLAGRAAYLTGLAVLIVALLVQGITHSIDPWIPAALGLMIVVKVIARTLIDSRE